MTPFGPLKGGGPRSERNLRVAGERSYSRSDAGCAILTSRSSPSLSKPTAPEALLSDTALLILLMARGRSRFDALLDGTQIVKASANPIADTARVLHSRGFADDRLLIARHEGSDQHAISGRLGYWRNVRIREDRGRTRHVAWKPRPRRVGAKKGRTKFKAVEQRPENKNVSATIPGAAREQSTTILRRRDRPIGQQP